MAKIKPDLVLKQHNTYPALETTLEKENEGTKKFEIIPLGSAQKVKLLLRGIKTKTALEGICTFPEAATGRVIYQWVPSDTAVVDLYEVEWEIEWNDGRIENIPNEGVKHIEIEPVI